MAILAAGVGFAIRGGIFANWGADFGFTGAQLGAIGGAGFSGFCFGIVIGGVLCDKIGYGKLVIVAFALHVLSAFVTFGATDKSNAYNMLYWGMFIFAYANGTLEAVANPLVATLFPHNRTHYLNILHASWPAGLILGGAAGWLMGADSMLGGKDGINWKIQLALYLVPTVAYGFMFFGQSFPKSEASEKGLSLGEMFKDVGILGGAVVCFLVAKFFNDALQVPEMYSYAIGGVLLVAVGVITQFSIGSVLLFVLFITHALVGAVELGTDGWIQNITGNILTPGEGKILFVFTSTVMFLLRFCADFIEKKIGLSPVGILLVCASLACVGLNLVSGIATFAGALLALTVYAVGKTFFWPTMLAVVSDRFPRSGAIAISIMGGIGMMSAGLIGSPGLGYAKDRFAGEALQTANKAAYDQFKAEKPSKFLIFADATGLDGAKLGEAQKVEAAKRTPEQKAAAEASIAGDRKTLIADSAIPATMAVIYLLMMLYFKSIGGYKAVHIEGTSAEGKH
ncbi:MAG: MFS transporter [Verrucomicrobia bacterium]|nr:MFS transporter [Verrucomicrobiota bacterium]NBU10584.1 MFS transporter [Pseudomonadota bacterium]NDA65760.1 MFS transporter [Verrucomicrobiota bacterium]NDB74656.1 MFS transporter [Verrucomicrobiota bacterium]NDD38994.1 MFS transporter [Verrucomicrobiota bacterium]